MSPLVYKTYMVVVADGHHVHGFCSTGRVFGMDPKVFSSHSTTISKIGVLQLPRKYSFEGIWMWVVGGGSWWAPWPPFLTTGRFVGALEVLLTRRVHALGFLLLSFTNCFPVSGSKSLFCVWGNFLLPVIIYIVNPLFWKPFCVFKVQDRRKVPELLFYFLPWQRSAIDTT